LTEMHWLTLWTTLYSVEAATEREITKTKTSGNSPLQVTWV